MGGNVEHLSEEEHRKNESQCLQLHFLLAFLCPLALVSMADQVHPFKGVHYVPIKAIRNPEQKWLSVGWLSKQMMLNNYRASPVTLGFLLT